eukprot:TRINITY_DN12842_c0_g1_i8.p2 TRINITY_DN12842_c0_g1~~TRINITY_DN12842_c0_g1_i8.p2  ORF type:complete len:152 (-),score=36.90 TRINITY_DN12842_c0_g1_i8:123-578(-)
MNIRSKIRKTKVRINKSLNQCTRKQELNRIMEENERIARRLMEKTPLISHQELDQQFSQHKRYRSICIRFQPDKERTLGRSYRNSLIREGAKPTAAYQTVKGKRSLRKKRKPKISFIQLKGTLNDEKSSQYEAESKPFTAYNTVDECPKND